MQALYLLLEWGRIMNALFERCSVRKFKSEAIDHEKIRLLLKAAFCAPSARNACPWKFIVIQDRNQILELAKFSCYATPLQTAPLAIVVCANTKRNPSLDYCQQDLAAATQNILIQSKELGLGSCWLGGYPNLDRIEYLKEYLHEEETTPMWVIAIGVPDEEEIIKDKWEDTCVQYF